MECEIMDQMIEDANANNLSYYEFAKVFMGAFQKKAKDYQM